MPQDLTDTDKKVFVRDHDILIQLTTQMGELIRRFDDNLRYQQDQDKSYAIEMKGVAVEQARVSSSVDSLQKDMGALENRMSRLESKSNFWDVINSFGVIVSAAIGYFFGSK